MPQFWAERLITIATFFDPVCPWCYIGKARLDRATDSRPRGQIERFWRPFLLNPDMPAEGVDRQAYLRWKFGGESGAAEVIRALVEAAESESLDFQPDRISRTPNTVNAHRMLHWANLEGLDVSQMIDQLYASYFCRGLDIGRAPVLAEIAERCGFDGPLVRRLLAGDSDHDQVATWNRRARRMGIDSIPCSIVNDDYVIRGAQSASVWNGILDRLETGAEN